MNKVYATSPTVYRDAGTTRGQVHVEEDKWGRGQVGKRASGEEGKWGKVQVGKRANGKRAQVGKRASGEDVLQCRNNFN
jgi:hypothetical protein